MSDQTKKQAEMKEQIAMYLRKKDYYDIMGLTKTCTEPDIKKSYKKLALRFHPDKNSIEGSKEVFKKVSNAYTTLIDAQKRASYDRYGPEEDREPRFRTQRQYQQGFNQQQEFEDIFRAFFGGMPQGRYQNNHYQHFTFNMGGQRGNNQANGGNSNMLFFVLIFFVIYILPSFLSGKEDSPYSTTQTGSYKILLKTPKFQVPFYVKQEFYNQNKNTHVLKAVETSVDKEFYIQIFKQCDHYKTYRYYPSSNKEKYRQSCVRMQVLNNKHPEYIRDLIYGY